MDIYIYVFKIYLVWYMLYLDFMKIRDIIEKDICIIEFCDW